MPAFRLRRNNDGELVLVAPTGEETAGVAPVRGFPLSDPLHCISLCDAQGHEVDYLGSLDNVDPDSRTLLEAELAAREFVPVITRIRNTPPHSEPARWEVETDRGITAFEIENEESVHSGDGNRVSIVDSRGIRYEIPDVRKLDSHSRKVLDRFL